MSSPLALEPPNLHVFPPILGIHPTILLNVTPLLDVVETLGTISRGLTFILQQAQLSCSPLSWKI